MAVVNSYRTAIGATVEPVAPTSFSGSTINANSYARWAASSSSLRFSSRKIPLMETDRRF